MIETLLERLKDNPCTDCRQSFRPEAMEFDHVRGKKKFAISQSPGDMEAVRRELEKCELVCANCHRQRTAMRHLATKFEQESAEIERLRGLGYVISKTCSPAALSSPEDGHMGPSRECSMPNLRVGCASDLSSSTITSIAELEKFFDLPIFHYL